MWCSEACSVGIRRTGVEGYGADGPALSAVLVVLANRTSAVPRAPARQEFEYNKLSGDVWPVNDERSDPQEDSPTMRSSVCSSAREAAHNNNASRANQCIQATNGVCVCVCVFV